MKALKLFYGIALGILFFSLFRSPKAELIEFDFIYMLIITVGIPVIFLPFIMLTKSNKFYNKAKKEGRTRGIFDKSEPPIEEEYKTDSIILTTSISFLFLLLTYFLWK